MNWHFGPDTLPHYLLTCCRFLWNWFMHDMDMDISGTLDLMFPSFSSGIGLVNI
jgi:hypothetical protein